MKYIDEDPMPILELTKRNINTLLSKLDDPLSARTLLDPGQNVFVRAVEGDQCLVKYTETQLQPIVELTRLTLETLLELDRLILCDPTYRIKVKAVENEEHYTNRNPGPMFMPSTGKVF